MNPYDKALDAIMKRVNMSLLHSSDRHAIAQIFDHLIRSGRNVGGPDRIGDYLRAKGAPAHIVEEIQGIYEAIYALHDGGPAWSDDLLKSL